LSKEDGGHGGSAAAAGWVAQWNREDWLVATSRGLWLGRPGHEWRASGPSFQHSLNVLTRCGEGVIGGADGGLWLIEKGKSRWRQLHDELVTVVYDVAAPGPEVDSILVATGYGVHRPRGTEQGALRWTNCSEALTSPNQRFSTALLAMDQDTWLVGTEAGLCVMEGESRHWSSTALIGSAVRALLATEDGFWAGNDAGEIWHSDTGREWQIHSRIAPGESVLALAQAPDHLLAGTSLGVAVNDSDGWRHIGPPLTIVAVAVDPSQPSVWLAGASPGGLWWSSDSENWQQVSGAPGAVRHLLAPGANQ
jgi:hypothetical protein